MKLGRKRRLLVATGLAILALSILTLLALVAGGLFTGQVRVVSEPALDAAQLLSNSTLAAQYHIGGVLIVTTLGDAAANYSVVAGQKLTTTFVLRYVSYSPTVSEVSVSFVPEPGQQVVGSVDLTTRETLSPSTVEVGAQPIVVQITLNTAGLEGPLSFSLVPDAFVVSPSAGVAVYYESSPTVSIVDMSA